MITIPLKSVLEAIDENKSFAIQFVTANRKTRVAGEIVSLHLAIQAKYQRGISRLFAKSYTSDAKKKKDPRHWRNATRNIWDKEGNRFYKIHIRLIIQFNGLPVRYGI